MLSAPNTAYAGNLVTNGNFSAGNTGFSTNYQFVGSGTSFQPGTYGIRTSSKNFNPNFVSFGDHTTGTGNMMLVDGLTGSIWSETVAVQANSIYDFSAWITAADNVNLPDLRFSINGVQIGSDTALPASAGQWQNFTASWKSDSTTSAIITIVDVNPNPLAAGNDLALDDISFTGSSPVPEASSVVSLGLLLLLGMGSMAVSRRRKGVSTR